ncbi:MAG: hypothetical protein B7Y56_03405 [Gallionellales bacterium 35-53-114]|jgi:hypothetical protein|nr:MAG: hypothetical protein B7Y56_03405 [Gallionellales bacterium 35-53-114]OYZ65152.1 MAG: hypothetical protein B7Y04_00565 [Gallionellales bacterium 24-53-125]OZB08060.1 MAG: hypothetical protein B7X61_11015 [Gallionellales bacterium 39-52-133]HQS59964.1 DUF1799 domain-containing protein [Gallionellaceae bacterium]HQS76654.1 DUF1799 domain-containing protein [Gallionellaceae bacterium]
MQDAGRELHPDDMPPAMQWEAVVWELYSLMSTQWRVGSKGEAIGLDYNPAIALMQFWEWPLDVGLQMLQSIELEMLRKSEN